MKKGHLVKNSNFINKPAGGSETVSPEWASNRKVALLFGITNDHAFALANVLQGIRKHSPRFWRKVIVYHEGLSEYDQAALCKIEPCEFVRYEPPFMKNASFSKWALNMYSMLMFARYEAFRLLDEYDAVLWSDVDVLIRGDISALVKPGAVSGIGMTLSKREDATLMNCFFTPVPGFDMDAGMFNSGIMVVTRELKNHHELYSWLNDKTIEYAPYLKWPDQGMLNLMVAKFDLQTTFIDLDRYHKHPFWDRDGASVIVHSHGPEKFWNFPDFWCKYPEWRRNHKKWLATRKECQPTPVEPLVSVVIPTLNAERYLRRALISMLEQTMFEQEIIVIDGGSKDATLEIVKSFKDERIRVIEDQSKKGIAASLNLGIKSARGKYIARMDADDISLPGRLAAQFKFLEANPEFSACGSWAQTIQNSSGVLRPYANPDILECSLLTSTPFVHPSMMWRAEDFDSNQLWYDESYTANEDFELWQRASKNVKFSNVTQPLLCYRMHDSNGHQNELTRLTQLKLIDRAFKELGVAFSKKALLLLDQRNYSPFLSDKAIALAMNEIYRGFLKVVSENNTRYNKRALAWHLLCHLRWVYFERAYPRRAKKSAFNRTARKLGWAAKTWIEYVPEENFGEYKTRLKRYWSMFKASPVPFVRKAFAKVFLRQ